MKSYTTILAFIIAFCAFEFMTPKSAAAQQGSASFQLFYDELSPYGTWVDYQDYGYVWVPNVDANFSPYGSNGHWVFTSDGWTWASNFNWGWAPFHYGRWAYDDSYGWLWVPDNEWAPAWVTWRRSEGYYGWTPMGPGITLEFTFGGGYRVPNERWIFVNNRDMNRGDIDRYYIDRSTNITIINNTTVINNITTDPRTHSRYSAGPGRDEVQRVTRTPVRTVAISEDRRPGQSLKNDRLNLYRPRVQASTINDKKPVPTRVGRLSDVKPISDRRKADQVKSPPQSPNNPQNSAPKPDIRPAVRRDNQTSSPKNGGSTPPVRSADPQKSPKVRLNTAPASVKPVDREGTAQPARVTAPTDNTKRRPQPSPNKSVPQKVRRPEARQPRVASPPAKDNTRIQPPRQSPAVRSNEKAKTPQDSKPSRGKKDDRVFLEQQTGSMRTRHTDIYSSL